MKRLLAAPLLIDINRWQSEEVINGNMGFFDQDFPKMNSGSTIN